MLRCGPMTVPPLHAFNMAEARRITRSLLIENPVKPDHSADYVAVQGWPLIIALYTGVEQALKMLLLTPLNPRFSREELKSRKFGHNLKKLYSNLETVDRDHIELHFKEHRSLHDYDTPGFTLETAEQFIAHINGSKTPQPDGKKQSGSISWRYILLDGVAEVTPTSLWTMYDIWDAICCRIRREVFNKPDDCFRLSRRFDWQLLDLTNDRLDRYPAQHEIDAWMVHKDGDGLSAWIDLLVKVHWGALQQVPASDRLRPELAKMADRALKQMASDSADPDEAMLLHRIQQEPHLAWNPADGTFGSEAR